uniref:CUE domain containing 1 n=1 Tax=Bubo bubo TaxID=30461 RepID=A0A8C0FQA8_BUBBB
MEDFKTMFPNMDYDIIECVLRANNGAVDATIDQLLQMNLDSSGCDDSSDSEDSIPPEILERTLEPDSSDEEPPPVYSPPAYESQDFGSRYPPLGCGSPTIFLTSPFVCTAPGRAHPRSGGAGTVPRVARAKAESAQDVARQRASPPAPARGAQPLATRLLLPPPASLRCLWQSPEKSTAAEMPCEPSRFGRVPAAPSLQGSSPAAAAGNPPACSWFLCGGERSAPTCCCGRRTEAKGFRHQGRGCLPPMLSPGLAPATPSVLIPQL